MRRWGAVPVVGVLCALVPLTGPAATRAGAASGDPVAIEQQFAARINSLRASRGLGALSVDAQLTGVARQWAATMARAGAISHNPSLASQVSQSWVDLGENVGTGADADSLFSAFVNSPPHYANLVNPVYTKVGVGVALTSAGTIYTSHEFMTLAPAASQVAAAPAPKAPASVRHATPVRSPAPVARAVPRPAAPVAAPAAHAAPASPAVPAPPAVPAARPDAAPAADPAVSPGRVPVPHVVQSLDVLRSFDPDQQRAS